MHTGWDRVNFHFLKRICPRPVNRLCLGLCLVTAVLEMLTWQLLDHTPNVNHCSTRPVCLVY